jgi:TldD protein
MRLGGAAGYEILNDGILMEKAREAAMSTIRLLGARSAPSGKFTVIADPDLAGVFAHEAVGHATEADLVLSGDSILKGVMGQKIGNELVSIFDDPTIPAGFGSFPYDDEGVKARKKMLIENGVLMEFLNSRETAGKMNTEPNGSARAQSAGSSPLVRMSNTMIGNGDQSFEELIEDIDYGVYLKGTRGGQVDTAKGMFQFNAAEGYLIEKGNLISPLKDVSLSGSTLETLNNIDALANDFRLGSPGFCGKGQLVSVCDGGPHIRIRNAVVGGR